jgi:uncharacterized repeat protein (TIGR02543 family)
MKKRWKAARYAASVCVVLGFCAFFSACDVGLEENPPPHLREVEEEGDAFTVTFVSNGGPAVAAQTVVKGAKVTEPEVPAKAGFTFMGWYKEADFQTPYNFNDPVNTDITLYAKWLDGDTPTFTVTFETNGGSPVPNPQHKESGSKITPPTDPEKVGHDFDGWYNGSVEWNFEEDTVTVAVMLTARWTPKKFTITFDSNGGSVVDPAEVDFGVTIPAPTAPAKIGYEVEGWYNGNTKWDFTVNTVSGAITLTARWKLAASSLGVWQNNYTSGSQVFLETLLLLEDEKVWLLQYVSGVPNPGFRAIPGTWSELSSGAVFDNDTTLTVTGSDYSYIYIKNTVTKVPAGDPSIVGFWIHNYGTVDLGNDGTATLGDWNGETSLTLKYRVESGTLYLLTNDNTNYVVVFEIPMSGDSIDGLIKTEAVDQIAGIWKRADRPYYYKLNNRAMGTFHAYGKTLPMTDVIIGGKINGDYSYTISTSGSSTTLTVNRGQSDNIVYTKLTSEPSSTSAGGDSSLTGSWNADTYTTAFVGITNITFQSDGTGIIDDKQLGIYPMIWKKSGTSPKNLEMYYYPSLQWDARVYFPNYTVLSSGPTLRVPVGDGTYLRFTKQTVFPSLSLGRSPINSGEKSELLDALSKPLPLANRVLRKTLTRP